METRRTTDSFIRSFIRSTPFIFARRKLVTVSLGRIYTHTHTHTYKFRSQSAVRFQVQDGGVSWQVRLLTGDMVRRGSTTGWCCKVAPAKYGKVIWHLSAANLFAKLRNGRFDHCMTIYNALWDLWNANSRPMRTRRVREKRKNRVLALLN